MSAPPDASRIDPETLAAHDFFAPLTAQERAALLAAAHRETFAKGQIVLQKDEIGDFALLVLSGSLRVFANNAEGKEITLAFLEQGALVGEMALIDGAPRHTPELRPA